MAVAFWPPQLYSSPMPGNELTAAFFGTAALTTFLVATRPSQPSPAALAAAGALGGLALLSKFSALVPLLAMVATLALRWSEVRSSGNRFARKLVILLGLACLLAAPFYVRNISEFGNPFELSRSHPCCAPLEARQQPGERKLHDCLAFPPRLFIDPQPREDHLLRSVWGSLYVRMWAEKLPDPGMRIALVGIGVVPTGLAVLGFALALHAVVRRIVGVKRRRDRPPARRAAIPMESVTDCDPRLAASCSSCTTTESRCTALPMTESIPTAASSTGTRHVISRLPSIVNRSCATTRANSPCASS